jgi:DNA-binding beta-propeller fold protein YncE
MHGVAVDRKGDVLIGNPDTGAIDVYPPGSRRPSKTIKTRKYIQPILIALDERDGKLYVTDPPYSTGEKGKLLVFSYPQGKLVSQVEVHGDPDGVVVSPF